MSILKELWNIFTRDSKISEEVYTPDISIKEEQQKASRSFEGFQDMCLQEAGPGQSVSYDLGRYSTTEVVWVSKEIDREGNPVCSRIPADITSVYKTGSSFTAAGRHYRSLKELAATPCNEPDWYKDIYGRDVLYLRRRFPCFDSYDYMTENRYYRWIFIFDDHTLTRVYHTDEQNEIFVTEDVRYIETDWWETIKTI